MKRAINKVKQHVDNPLEKLFNLDDLLGFSSSAEEQKKDGETVMFEGEEISLKAFQEKKVEEKEKSEIEVDINYTREIIHVGEKFNKRETQEIEAQLKDIMAEIKKLADGSKDRQMQFKEIAVDPHV